MPDALVRDDVAGGPAGFIAERIASFAEAGVTTLLVSPAERPIRARTVRFVEEVLELRSA